VFEHKDTLTNKGEPSAEAEKPLEESDEGVTFRAHSYYNKDEATLLRWILAQGNKASLQDILDYCQKGLALVSDYFY
jgi:hypothetical protein